MCGNLAAAITAKIIAIYKSALATRQRKRDVQMKQEYQMKFEARTCVMGQTISCPHEHDDVDEAFDCLRKMQQWYQDSFGQLHCNGEWYHGYVGIVGGSELLDDNDPVLDDADPDTVVHGIKGKHGVYAGILY
jgi:hypothetical protein